MEKDLAGILPDAGDHYAGTVRPCHSRCPGGAGRRTARHKVFEGTHEVIIEKETFEIVQKIRAGKRRPTRMGEMPMFSGLLYCADCGSRMTFHRETNQSPDRYNFCCGNYRSSTSSCSMHYIRNVVVERIVLENLKEVIHYVSDYEDNITGKLSDERFIKMSKPYDTTLAEKDV